MAKKISLSSATKCIVRSIKSNIQREGWLPQLTIPETKWSQCKLKTYWSIFWKDFLMGKNYQLFHPFWSIIWNQTWKWKLTSLSFLASKCTTLINSSTIHNSLNYVSTARLSSFCFNEKVILKIVNALNHNKAHGDDSISIWTIKLCSESAVKLVYDFQ